MMTLSRSIPWNLIEPGYLQAPELTLWRSSMMASSLYEDHWRLAYEAHEHGWLLSKSDYIADPFFSILQGHSVRFYGDNLAPTGRQG